MKVIGFEDFSFEKYNVSDVSAIKQRNNWAICSHPEGRIYNGFLVITEGECVYRWEGAELTLTPGSVIYLPKGSVHSVTAPIRSLEFFRINFTVTALDTSEEAVFSRLPMLITHNAPKSILDLSEELTALTLRHHTHFKTMASLCELIDLSVHALTRDSARGIDIAINYIKEHYTEDVDLTSLASLCFMSYSHFFRSFRQKFGMTPIELKNSLRMEKAKKLLSDMELSVGEIAELLGFEGISYFTRAFKKHIGVSPSIYRKSLK